MKLSKEEFEAETGRADSDLANASVPIPARPIQSTIAIFKKYAVSGPIIHPFKANTEFPVDPLNLSDHISEWYKIHYGNKIKIDPSPGRFPLIIEGAAYQCRIPLVIGIAHILSSKSSFKDKRILNAIDH